MNIHQTILKLIEFEPFIMPQIELFEDIRLVQTGTGSMTTLEFTGHNIARKIEELEHRAQMAEEDAAAEQSKYDNLQEDARALRNLIRDLIPFTPPGVLDKYEHVLKSNCINRHATQEKKIQGDPS